MKSSLLLPVLLLLAQLALAQGGHILRYDARTRQVDTLAAAPFDVAASSGSTPSSPGLLPGQVPLAMALPTQDLLPGVPFTVRRPAAEQFTLTDYPVRTAVALLAMVNGRLTSTCSGTLVGERFVLTAAHCLTNGFPGPGPLDYDSILVDPAYNNGQLSGLPRAYGTRFYIFKSWFTSAFDDIALLELNRPIGRATGWLGLGFSTDSASYEGTAWQKFSYPGLDLSGRGRYNGDTLFYEQGAVHLFADRQRALLLVPGHPDTAPGQSGSSLFRTDNRTYWTAFGVLAEAYNYAHRALLPAEYATFRRILLTPGPPPARADLLVYPNPVGDELVVQLPDEDYGPVTLSYYNLLGQRLGQEQGFGSELRSRRPAQLAPGTYVLRVEAGGRSFNRKIVKAGL